MDKFVTLTSVAAPLPEANVTTDTIIPAEWMRKVSADLSDALFAAWRFDEDGAVKPDFVLNRPEFRQAHILLAGPNFGCGSSRENAAWALEDFGVRCIIAPSFADIFVENCARNGMLTLTLPEEEVNRLVDETRETDPPRPMTVDLDAMRVTTPAGRNVGFEIDPQQRKNLMEGLGEITQTMRHEREIDAFQEESRARHPWLHLTPGQDAPVNHE